MSLRCMVCHNPVDEGLNFCPSCRTGFLSQLECVSCGRPVPRGSAACLSCSRSAPVPVLSPPSLVAVTAPQFAPPVVPGLPPHVSAPVPVADRYVVRAHGVEAEVRIPPGDAEVMNLMGQVVVILHTFAARVNNLSGHGQLTRKIIHDARVLATDIQEELEQRKGPGR